MYVCMCNVRILEYTEPFTLDLKNFSIRPYKNNTVRVIVLCYIFEKNCVATYDHYGHACIRTHIEALALTHSFAYIHTHIYIFAHACSHTFARNQASFSHKYLYISKFQYVQLGNAISNGLYT